MPSTKLKRHARQLLVTCILVACVYATTRLFDWPTIHRALSHLDVSRLVCVGIPILGAISALRGWRWLTVLGIRPVPRTLWQSFCANGAAAGLASITPFQLGEIVKIRLIPDHHGSAWRLGVSAFFVERMLDLGTMCCLSLAGLAVHFGYSWAALPALSLPIACSFAASRLACRIRLSERMAPYAEVLRHTRRTVQASLLSLPIWMLYCALWWTALGAMHVPLPFHKVAILLGGVMLAVIASMTPGGLGVSELSSRGLLIWLGESASQAEIGAIALRLLTPLIALIGLTLLLPLLKQLRHPKQG